MNTTTAEVAMSRSSSDWTNPAALRALLKSNLGLNARQVTVRQRHSLQYRALALDVARLTKPEAGS